ncbi:MAG: hypothetical protein A3J74_07445 [Elusimicrobia bacterium RIFCSPHIGHO2_02_FULL_57_9]|nr:MAG: hypothetical protein A3J74_07445 [Elusimicrobia bacterium RIFCSPHIGHO2_02_FULL_57_9]
MDIENETMEALLAQQAAVSKKLADKEIAWVKVIQVSQEEVLVDIGEKRDGIVPRSEFDQPPAAGQRIPVVLAGSRRDGSATLSYKRAQAQLGWQNAVKAFNEKVRVRGQVRSSIKGGFLVDVGGVTGFLPASLSDLRPVRSPQRMIGMGVRCYIIELNQDKKQVVLSRKAVLEEEAAKRRTRILSELKVGQVCVGRIVKAGPLGLTVDIGGVEGFVRAADIAWGAQKSSHERGTKLKVKVLAKPMAANANSEGRQGEPAAVGTALLLGIKQLTSNPADAIRKKYPPKTAIQGKVLEAGAAGVKIFLDAKISAVCPPAETDPDAPCKAGDRISCVVTGINPDTFDLVVSINKFNEIRDRKKVAQYLKAPPPLTLGQLLSPQEEDKP